MSNPLYLIVVGVVLVESRRVVDLTHTLDKDAPKLSVTSFGVKDMTYYKREKPLENYIDEDGTWLALGVVEFYEHMGTHIDAPFHFGRNNQKLHEIPVQKMVGPGVVINVREKVKNNEDYGVTVEDILEYEEKFGRIPPGAIVLMSSGWDKRYPSEKRVFATDDIDNFPSYHYPGYTLEACKMLHTERQINVLGTDSVSIDPKATLSCHKYLQPLEVPLLEYVANLENIPQNGTTIVLGVPKIRDATGAPTRILAFVDEDGNGNMNSSASHIAGFTFGIVLCYSILNALF